jgi:hypothetical protein
MSIYGIFVTLWLIALPVSAIAGLVFVLYFRNRPRPWGSDKLVGGILFFVLLSPCLAIPTISAFVFPQHSEQLHIQREQVNGDVKGIIMALDQYHQVYGQFPSTLDVLVPEFIPRVPMQPTGYPFLYTRNGDEFALSYAEPYLEFALFCTYTTGNQKTRCND